uniref:Conotoxin Di6.12 n=1 Tax=Conus distans TaxID=72281 RepID=M9PMU8_CONDI|nr:conotoxin Di6.12 [Conus distans]
MSGLGFMVLTFLLLVSMATSKQDGRVRRRMLHTRLVEGACTSPSNCPTGQECCPDKLDEPEGSCANSCPFY